MFSDSILSKLPSPVYVVDRARLVSNAKKIDTIRLRTGCKINIALKGFAMFRMFPYISAFLDGASTSSLHESYLARDYFKKEIHVYAPAYKASEIKVLCPMVNHMTFNSLGQFNRFKDMCAPHDIKLGLRINPEHSEVKTALYDPCSKLSRLGVPISHIKGSLPNAITGILVHNLCEHNADALQRTIQKLEATIPHILKGLDWLNLGGGHHITRDDYDTDLLVRCINRMQDTYKLKVILEPGEAVALDAGYFMTQIEDVLAYDEPLAILDSSATAHMPDILEMPYRPTIWGAGKPGEKVYTYHLGGLTCLAGDVFGTYSFDKPLQIGQPLVFTDMAHYTMVKNTQFNGVPLPSIAILHPNDEIEIVKTFAYADYCSRLS